MNRLKRKLKKIKKLRNARLALKRGSKTKRIGIQIQKRRKSQQKILLKSQSNNKNLSQFCLRLASTKQ